MGDPQTFGWGLLNGKIGKKWMIWGYPYLRNPSDIINDVPMKRIGTIWIYIYMIYK
jgi:hypothetical protein